MQSRVNGESVLVLDLSSTEKTATTIAARISFWGLILVLLFGPLAFGAVEPWAILAQEAAAALLTAFWLVAWMRDARIHPHPNALYWPGAALAGLIAAQLVLRVPPYAHATLLAAFSGAAYALIFFAANESFKDPKHVYRAAQVLVTFGFLLAIYSILGAFIAPEKLLGFRTPRVASMPFGPYVNHAHYAGLMEMLAPFALLLGLRRGPRHPRTLFYALAALVMTASVFLSESRAGMIVIILEFAAVLVLVFRQGMARWLFLATGLLAAFLLWTGAAALESRISSLRHPELSLAMRSEIAKDTVRMAEARPWMGWGLGSFPVVYPQFRSFATDEVVGAAHNDYLQAWAELGTLGAILLLWFLYALYRSSKRHFERPLTDSVSCAKLAAVVGVSGLLLHSFSDFNLHIPGNAALFVALCAMATVRSEKHA